MARIAKPWWREESNCYYVTVRGVQHRLDPKKSKADRMFHDLMTKPEESLEADSAVVLIDTFLHWCQENKPDSYDWYYRFLNPFCKVVQDLTVEEVLPKHVEQFIGKKTWGPSGRRAAITAIKRAFNWGVKQGHIQRNPVKEFEKPEAPIREQVISLEAHKQILKRVSKAFGELLELAWETGARPFELYRLETRHLEMKNCRAVFPRLESKGKRRQRVIYFSKKAMQIIKRNMLPAGPVMRNDDGQPWTIYSINCAFSRLQAVMGREVSADEEIDDDVLQAKMAWIKASRADKGKPELKTADLKRQAIKSIAGSAARKKAPKYCLYAYRHSFGHRKLTEGTDSMVVATWLGHRDTQMLARVYGHIHKNQDFLLTQLNRQPAKKTGRSAG